MNRQRQKEIRELGKHLPSIIGLLERAAEKARVLCLQELSYFHHIPEREQLTARSSRSDEAIESLELAHESLAHAISNVKTSIGCLNDAADE